MAIAKTGASLRDMRQDCDLPANGSLRDITLSRRAQDYKMDSATSTASLRGTCAAIMPFAGINASPYSRSQSSGGLYAANFLSDYSISVTSSGEARCYAEHPGGNSSQSAVIHRNFGLLPSSGRFEVIVSVPKVDSYMKAWVEVHGYKDGFLAGADKLYGYNGNVGSGTDKNIGTYDIDPDHRYLMVTLQNTLQGSSNRRQGYVYYRDLRVRIL